MDEHIRARVLDAVAAYLVRIGFSEVMVSDAPDGRLTAVDGVSRVAFLVTIRHSAEGDRHPRVTHLPTGCDRLDAVDVLIIGPNRALLRHRQDLHERLG